MSSYSIISVNLTENWSPLCAYEREIIIPLLLSCFSRKFYLRFPISTLSVLVVHPNWKECLSRANSWMTPVSGTVTSNNAETMRVAWSLWYSRYGLHINTGTHQQSLYPGRQHSNCILHQLCTMTTRESTVTP